MAAEWFSTVSSGFSGALDWLVGASGGSTSLFSRWIFLRALGLIYLIAFVSLWVQVKGLIGSQGILPVQEYLGAAKGALGLERFRLLPTIFWFSSSDAALHVVCALGVLAAFLLTIGIAPMPCLILLWVLYLSLTVAGQDFLSFQWDILLLEVGFLAIFIAPMSLVPGLQRETPVPALALVLLLWLLFRFSVESGVVKLTSGDSTWRDLTALTYHYFTQPLPTWTAWFMHHLPAWFHKLSTIVMYVLEIAAPFLLFLGRAPRIAGALGIILLQLIIAATGNYTFFNLLTIALCFLAIDDALWQAILPDRVLSALHLQTPLPSLPSLPSLLVALTTLVALLYLLVSFFQLLETFSDRFQSPRIVQTLERWVAPFHAVNGYGLFRVMTTERPEIVIEGSDDGKLWKPYEFRWKPGDLRQRPRFVAPHQPRLDWQMWFAALSRFERTHWFQSLLRRLLEGSPPVLAQLKLNPFPERPPKFIRALLYDYRFTTPKERRESGDWWHREERGLYAPILSLR